MAPGETPEYGFLAHLKDKAVKFREKRMDKKTFQVIENYMLDMMNDSAHDSLHIYRVLYQALRIARGYDKVNRDILIASCLLHDIGRMKEFQNPQLCHAVEGGEMAYSF